jgi:hypothetical protein
MISNCDDVRGMLPWLLNGTLGDDERRQVLQHLSTCESCRRDLADTRLAAEIFDQHPPADAILALAWDEPLRGIDPALLEEHLATCPRCAAELELARMSRRLEEDEKIVPLTRRAATPAPVRSTGWRGWKASALAAGLAGVVALAGWLQTAGRVHTLEEQLVNQPAASVSAPPPAVSGESKQAQQLADERGRQIEQLEARLNQAEQKASELNGQVEQLSQIARAQPAAPGPQINAWVQPLQPSGDVVRGGGPAAALEVPARTSSVLLLSASHSETHSDHAVEIVNTAGKVVWSATGLTRDAQNNLYVLTLPPGALPAGAYTIRVSGMAGGQREPLESYSIRVE